VIVGDNLQVMLALQKSYSKAVKLVYIDPPYNTGNDYIYKDNFAVDEDLYLQETRQADLDGRLVTNPQTSGRFHSNWLSFIQSRSFKLIADTRHGAPTRCTTRALADPIGQRLKCREPRRHA
jgi:adenine specific DNA methylase Mod